MGYCHTPDGQDRSRHPMLGERVQGALDRWADLWLRGVQVTCGDWWLPVPTDVDNGATWSCPQKTGRYHVQSRWGQGGASGAFLSNFTQACLCPPEAKATHPAPPWSRVPLLPAPLLRHQQDPLYPTPSPS